MSDKKFLGRPLGKEPRMRTLAKRSLDLFLPPLKKQSWYILILSLTLLCALVWPFPQVAMWVAFMLAGYSAIANDSIQTIGTFISSSKHIRWYYLWLFMGGIFLFTVVYSWLQYAGDVSHGRLASPGLDEAPSSFSFLQLMAPLILLVLTRFRIPVSTSILLLSAFSTKHSTIGAIVMKSLAGYLLAFVSALVVWMLVARVVKGMRLNRVSSGQGQRIWRVFQWLTSGFLWSMWLMQDASNIAVVLPRQLSVVELLVFVGYIFLGLGLLFYLRGDRIQRIVEQKTNVTDVRAATIIDLTYALILLFFKVWSQLPMSTTWVFIGLLAGREVAIVLSRSRKKRKKRTRSAVNMISRDVLYAGLGLLISVLLAVSINQALRQSLIELLSR